MCCFKRVILIINTLVIVPAAMASININVSDDTYNLLLRLEAEGVIKSGLLATRPLSRKDAARLILEAERNSEGRSLFLQQLVKSLKKRFKGDIEGVAYVKPLDTVYIDCAYSDRDGKELGYNDNGDDYGDGFNFRSGLSSGAELGRFSLYINPELRYSNGDAQFIIKRAYGALGFSALELQAGKDSQWWGPGYHGAILVSNNAEPLTMVKLTNPQPVLLPWIFEYLGPFRFVFFVTRLGQDRVVPEPYLWGMRFNFRPIPSLEAGIQRTAMLGGEGQPEDLGAWWRSFTAEEVPGESGHSTGSEGDQRAGFDVKVTLPFKRQPVQLYAEAAGEDEAGSMPYRWAYLGGVYLPGIFSDRLDLRAEYATTHVSGSPDVWYTHHVYGSGYTYKGRVIGHHMGTDSKDIFMELSYLVPEKNTSVSVSFDREEHNLSGSKTGRKDEFTLSAKIMLRDDMGVNASFNYGLMENSGNLPGSDGKTGAVEIHVNYEF